MATPKEELTRLIERQPDVMVERGLADVDAGRTISHEEMGRRIRSWPVGRALNAGTMIWT